MLLEGVFFSSLITRQNSSSVDVSSTMFSRTLLLFVGIVGSLGQSGEFEYQLRIHL